MVKNLPSDKARGFDRGWGTKIPHASEQLSPRVAVTEPVHSGACTSTSPCESNEDPVQPNKNKLIYF